MSPNYPSNYPDHSNISTPIEVPILNKIVLDFEDFDLEFGLFGSCQYDYVQGIF